MKVFNVQSTKRIEAVKITDIVQEYVSSLEESEGICFIYTPHTTGAITINEGFDPDVMHDLLSALSEAFPYTKNYRHAEGNSDAHIKASLIGNSRMVAFENGKLLLGTWEAIYFLEFDGPRNRKVYLIAK